MSKLLRPDSKGRICLGKLAEGVSSFRLSLDQGQRIVLEPMTEIPMREKWLHDNEEAMDKVKKGLKESKEGKVKYLGSFSDYLRTSPKICII